MPTFVIGIGGTSGAGKSTFAKMLVDRLGEHNTNLLSLDCYYKELVGVSFEELVSRNYDHPDSLDFDLLCCNLDSLNAERSIEAPLWDFSFHSRIGKVELYPTPITIVEGALLLSSVELRRRLNFSVFVFAPREVRFERRKKRDVEERGRDLEEVESRFINDVIPGEEKFVIPSANWAEKRVFNLENFHGLMENASRDFNLSHQIISSSVDSGGGMRGVEEVEEKVQHPSKSLGQYVEEIASEAESWIKSRGFSLIK